MRNTHVAAAARLITRETTPRRRSAHQPPEALLREMLCTVWTVLEGER